MTGLAGPTHGSQPFPSLKNDDTDRPAPPKLPATERLPQQKAPKPPKPRKVERRRKGRKG